ncbi:hypothetical protein CW304_09620 [Bacillus sp. UFRGS-B20]|nr:hypothetical protein CW304_09620 [Bacillus sp. UFRGS-B20]
MKKPLSLRGICLLEGWFSWFIVLWTVIFIRALCLSVDLYVEKIPETITERNGMSIWDWGRTYSNKTRHLWDDDKQLLESL